MGNNILLRPLSGVKVKTSDGNEMELNTRVGDLITIYPKELFTETPSTDQLVQESKTLNEIESKDLATKMTNVYNKMVSVGKKNKIDLKNLSVVQPMIDLLRKDATNNWKEIKDKVESVFNELSNKKDKANLPVVFGLETILDIFYSWIYTIKGKGTQKKPATKKDIDTVEKDISQEYNKFMKKY